MDLGPYAGFIIAAYGAAVLVVVALIAWVLRDLEARGITRRSDERKTATETAS
jgi:heme exporter protein CcmD